VNFGKLDIKLCFHASRTFTDTCYSNWYERDEWNTRRSGKFCRCGVVSPTFWLVQKTPKLDLCRQDCNRHHESYRWVWHCPHDYENVWCRNNSKITPVVFRLVALEITTLQIDKTELEGLEPCHYFHLTTQLFNKQEK